MEQTLLHDLPCGSLLCTKKMCFIQVTMIIHPILGMLWSSLKLQKPSPVKLQLYRTPTLNPQEKITNQ